MNESSNTVDQLLNLNKPVMCPPQALESEPASRIITADGSDIDLNDQA
jgi:hypothetical protein